MLTSPGYNPFAGRSGEERREWLLFVLWLTRQQHSAAGAWRHVEWVLQRPFQNVAEWLGEEGEKFPAQRRMRQISEALKTDWLTFAAERPSLSEAEIDAELTAIDEAPKPLPMRRRGRQKRDRSLIGAPLQ